MTDQHWDLSGAAPWVLAQAADGTRSSGGLAVDVGVLHQPTAYLGVAGVLAAWIPGALRHEVAPGRRSTIDVTVTLSEIHLAVSVAGPAPDVARALAGFDAVLAAAGDVSVNQALRDASLGEAVPLERWSTHYAVRWPGYRPHLATLGPVGLDAVGGVALGGFAAQVGAGKRVYWTNDLSVADRARASNGHGAPAADTSRSRLPPLDAVPVSGAVHRRHPTELCSVPLPATLEGDLAGWVLQELLVRRLTVLESLARSATVDGYDAGESTFLGCGSADILPGRDAEVLRAVVETLDDLADRPPPDADVARGRELRSQVLAAVDPSDPAILAGLARRHLRHHDEPTVLSLLDKLSRVDDDHVRDVLTSLSGEALVAVPAGPDTGAPLPWAERSATPVQGGDRFSDRTARGREVRCDGTGIGIVELERQGWRLVPVPRSQVDLARVVLRIDTADTCTLVDECLATVRLTWPSYRDAARLRSMVDAGTVGAARITLPGSSVAATTGRAPAG